MRHARPGPPAPPPANGRPARRGFRALLNVAVGAVLVGALTAPAAVADDNGLDEASRNRYVLDAKAAEVRASTTLTLRNTTPNRAAANGYTYFYFTSYRVPVPATAKDVHAVSNGTSLPVSLSQGDDPATVLATISFPRLLYGQSRTIVLSYHFSGAAFRSKDYTRVGPGYATFAASGFGDPGQVTVEVVLPGSMTFDATDDDFTRSRKGSTVTYTATTNTENGGIWTVVSARNPDRVAKGAITVGDTHLDLLAFPGDRTWTRFVRKHVKAGLPVLEKTIGAPWPGDIDTIREDSSPRVRGYDGWYDLSDDQITIVEDLHEDLLYHELTHGWFNQKQITGRWLYEGLAQAIADRTVRATHGHRVTHTAPRRSSSDAIPLTAWDESVRMRGVDDYGYAASYAAVTALLKGLDHKHVTAVLRGAYRGESAYDPAGFDRHVNEAATDWRRFLDLVETRGGQKGATAIYRKWVVDGSQRKLLAKRKPARRAYARLDRDDGDWLPPQGVRSTMTWWRFSEAEKLMKRLEPVATDAAAVQDAARSVGVTVPASVRDAYESANDDTSYTQLAALLPRATGTITAVGAASDAASADRDPLSALGATLLRVDDTASRARTALHEGKLKLASRLATQASDRADKALLAGMAVVVLLGLLLLGAVGGGIVLRRRATARRDDPTDGAADDPASPLAEHP